MRICYIIPYAFGGTPHYPIELANAMSAYADVVVILPNGALSGYIHKNIKILTILKPYYFSSKNVFGSLWSTFSVIPSFFRSVQAIKEIKPDIIHFAAPIIPPLLFAIRYSRLDKKIPIVHTIHAASPWESKGIARIIELLVFLSEKSIRYSKIVVHGNKDRDILIKNGFSFEKVEVIPHGAYTFFKNYSQIISSEKNCLLFFGRIEPYKGLEYLLKAVPLLVKETSNLKIIIAGEGDLTKYSSLLNNNSIFEIHNQFVPNEEVAILFQRAELIVLPYTQLSGQSGVINIAYAFGKPVIATAVGDIPDILTDGETGFLVPPKDSNALANAVIKLLKDEDLKRRMGTNALIKAQELSWDNIAKKYLEVYEKVIEKFEEV